MVTIVLVWVPNYCVKPQRRKTTNSPLVLHYNLNVCFFQSLIWNSRETLLEFTFFLCHFYFFSFSCFFSFLIFLSLLLLVLLWQFDFCREVCFFFLDCLMRGSGIPSKHVVIVLFFLLLTATYVSIFKNSYDLFALLYTFTLPCWWVDSIGPLVATTKVDNRFYLLNVERNRFSIFSVFVFLWFLTLLHTCGSTIFFPVILSTFATLLEPFVSPSHVRQTWHLFE